MAPGTLTVDEHLAQYPSKTILIAIKGDSMVDAGIHLGDVVWSGSSESTGGIAA
ncbi:MAG: hypothetical protein HYU77_03570 [Betaproteobacteria bacterium]|nr:hypothetical protein [Betaproteobacteria bacterium]